MWRFKWISALNYVKCCVTAAVHRETAVAKTSKQKDFYCSDSVFRVARRNIHCSYFALRTELIPQLDNIYQIDILVVFCL